jgi:hypothetical protein
MTNEGITVFGLNRLFRQVQWEGLDLPWHAQGGIRRIELGLRAWAWEKKEERRMRGVTRRVVAHDLSAA